MANSDNDLEKMAKKLVQRTEGLQNRLNGDALIRKANKVGIPTAVRDFLRDDIVEMLRLVCELCAEQSRIVEDLYDDMSEVEKAIPRHEHLMQSVLTGSFIPISYALAQEIANPERAEITDDMRSTALQLMAMMQSASQLAPGQLRLDQRERDEDEDDGEQEEEARDEDATSEVAVPPDGQVQPTETNDLAQGSDANP